MLGTTRFILAWFVMLSHLPFSPFASGFNPAVSAVIMFYFISGSLMVYSFNKEIKRDTPYFEKIIYFFIKRLLRLFPLYLIVLFLTIIAILIFGKSDLLPLLNQDLSFQKILFNTLLVFNNYVFPPLQLQIMLPHPLIPPTWSLSTEWHFYLLVPFLFYLLTKKKLNVYFYLIMFFSLTFELIAFSSPINWLNSDNFGYRYIFGVLWIFMFGFLYASKKILSFKILYILFLLYFLIFGFKYSMHPYVREVSLSIILLPLVIKVKDLEFQYDSFFGRLSYPIFLSHFFIFYIVEKSIGYKSHTLYFFVVFVFILLFAWILSKIQIKIDKIRHRF